MFHIPILYHTDPSRSQHSRPNQTKLSGSIRAFLALKPTQRFEKSHLDSVFVFGTQLRCLFQGCLGFDWIGFYHGIKRCEKFNFFMHPSQFACRYVGFPSY